MSKYTAAERALVKSIVATLLSEIVKFIFLKGEYTSTSIFRILNKIFVLREESRYYPKLEKVTLHKSGLILLGIDKRLTTENGNAIIGALLGIIGLILVYLGFYSRFSTINI